MVKQIGYQHLCPQFGLYIVLLFSANSLPAQKSSSYFSQRLYNQLWNKLFFIFSLTSLIWMLQVNYVTYNKFSTNKLVYIIHSTCSEWNIIVIEIVSIKFQPIHNHLIPKSQPVINVPFHPQRLFCTAQTCKQKEKALAFFQIDFKRK